MKVINILEFRSPIARSQARSNPAVISAVPSGSQAQCGGVIVSPGTAYIRNQGLLYHKRFSVSALLSKIVTLDNQGAGSRMGGAQILQRFSQAQVVNNGALPTCDFADVTAKLVWCFEIRGET